MSSLESLEIKKAKIDSLVAGFFKTGYKSTSNINQSELIQFLNRRSSSGKFDPIISGKLFEVLSLDAMSTITVEEFINGFLQFEEEIQKNAEDFSIKLSKEEEIFSKIENDFKKYRRYFKHGVKRRKRSKRRYNERYLIHCKKKIRENIGK